MFLCVRAGIPRKYASRIQNAQLRNDLSGKTSPGEERLWSDGLREFYEDWAAKGPGQGAYNDEESRDQPSHPGFHAIADQT